MTEPTVAGIVIAALVLSAFVVAAWKASAWLTRRGHVVRPLTMMDDHMTRIEKRAAEDRRAQTPGLADRDMP